MNKQAIIKTIISAIQAETQSKKSEYEAAYFTALSDSQFATLDKEIRTKTVELAKMQTNHSPKAMSDKLKDELTSLSGQREKLLQKYLPKNSIALCKTCNGTGYYNSKFCPCVMKRYSKSIAEHVLDKTIPNQFDSSLTTIFKNEDTKKRYSTIYRKLAEYCNKFPNTTKRNIILSGGTGTGKTYAAKIIANNLTQNGFSVLYLTSFSLIQRFKSYIQNYTQSEDDALFECDLLIIDDLGSEPIIRNISQEYLYNVINERLASSKAFIITTNLTPSDLLSRYDQRIGSRILSTQTSAVIEFKSDDLRIRS